MKELSFFLLKNSFGAKMRKGFKNFCNGDGSTSTLNQHHHHHQIDPSSSCMAAQSLADSPNYLNNTDSNTRGSRQPTLEEMILQLDLEEKMARRAKLDEFYEPHHRMSCVNSSDILRSARNALNQYPRFSLDGKDAMYRSSFGNLARPVISTGGGRRKGFYKDGNLVLDPVEKGGRRLPAKVAGESVVWCKPGVVGKLMGLEAMPMPAVNIGRSSGIAGKDKRLMIKRQNLRKRSERDMDQVERRRGVVVDASGNNNNKMMMATGVSNTPPVAVRELRHDDAGWPMRRFL